MEDLSDEIPKETLYQPKYLFIMKKSLLLIATSFLCSSLFAQHYEWTCAQINNNQFFESVDAAVAAGFNTLWTSPDYLGMPATDLIDNEFVKISLPQAYNYVGKGNSKYPGYSKYAYKVILGSSNTNRDTQIDATKFLDGLEGNDVCRKIAASDQNAEINVMQSIIKVEVAATPEGQDPQTSAVTIKWSRGGNNAALFVVDATKQIVTLQNVARSNGNYLYEHVNRFNVQQGHTYYILASENASAELYSIAFDNCASDQFEVLASEENSTSLWDCSKLPSPRFESVEAAVNAGYQTLWSSADYLGMPAADLIKNDLVTVSLPQALNYIGKGNGKYSGFEKYAYKVIMGSNNTNRDTQIDATKFLDGLEGNDICRKIAASDQNPDVNVMQAILKVEVAATPEGQDPETGRVILNYSRGGNNGALYVVDATKTLVTYQDVTRCPGDNIKTQSAIFNVQQGHTYYIVASENASVEFYAIGFCAANSEKYDALNSSTSAITAINSKPGFEKNVMYNILGQRVNGNAKGIVIMNGKKLLVK